MTHILMHSGRFVDVANVRPDDVSIFDVAHSLALLCRWNGHLKEFYSVAQHCVLCCDNAPAGLEAAALLHDAGEAYVGDLTRPVRICAGAAFGALDAHITQTIFQALGVPWPTTEGWAAISALDDMVLATEARDLAPPNDLFPGQPTLDGPIEAWGPIASNGFFLGRFGRYVERRGIGT